MNHRRTVVITVGALCVCLLIGLSLRNHTTGGRSGGPAPTRAVSFEEARNRAFEIIREREQWPESPEAVSKAFWEARAAKNYAEMEVLWPGTAASNWPEICRNEPNVPYVFGQAFRQAGEEGAAVPYASKDHFEAQETYNLMMRLSVLQTDKGPRYYIVGGN